MAGEHKKGRPRAPGEQELIAAIRSRAVQLRANRRKNGFLTLGIGDDCAVVRPRRGKELVVTTDLSLENIHFRRDWHPSQSVGHRCLARGLSDLAAMGARPEAAFLSLAVPAELTGPWMDGFLDGLMSLAELHHVPLAGGDMAKSPLVVADIVLIGSVPKGKALLRSGASAGDVIYVTGALGGSAAELRALERRPGDYRGKYKVGHPHLYPEPRLAAGRKLMRGELATAAIDLSSQPIWRICAKRAVWPLKSTSKLCLSMPEPPWSRHCTAEKITSCCSPPHRRLRCPVKWEAS
jgi:thiamine-monophosphate kinase